MNKLLARWKIKNISINKKLFLVQLALIALILPGFIFIYFNYINVEKTYFNIIDNNLAKIQALLETKSAAIVLEKDVNQFSKMEENKQNNNINYIADQKNIILANIDLMQQQARAYKDAFKKIDPESQSLMNKLDATQADIILRTVSIAKMKQEGSDYYTLKPNLAKLQEDVEDYKNLIATLLNKEYQELAVEKQQLERNHVMLIITIIGSFLGLFILAGILTWLLSCLIVRPLVNLRDNAKKIAEGNIDLVIHQNSNDEIGELEASIQTMVNKILNANEKILNTARIVGMADVANNVLHNVGNVLSSINVSVQLLREVASDLRVQALKKLSTLLNDNKDKLVEFFQTEKGQLIPGYINQLGNQFEKNQQDFVQEINKLSSHIKHIKDIITLEQELSVKKGMVESICLHDVIEEALKMSITYNTRSALELKKNYQISDKIKIDKIKLEQVLVNLLKNAKESFENKDINDKTIKISTFINDNKVHIDIEDNGEGIPEDLVSSIFSGGFTTKKKGHGFGLHFSALAVQDMGGELSVHSAGLGTGAKFSIVLPFVAGDGEKNEN